MWGINLSKNNKLLEAALSYAARGWRVFPCAPRTKIPLLSKKNGGNGCLDATNDVKQITLWWTKHPGANIALACGKESGVYVVDVDCNIKENKNGWESLRKLKEEGKELPATMIQDTPGGGAHYLYKSDNPPRNMNNFLNGIDIRCEGFYIVVAPSVHPNKKVYKWRKSTIDLPLAEYPDFMRPQKKKVVPAMPWLPKPVHVQKEGETSIIERARLYLAECDASVQGAGGHDALLWASRAMVIGFDLSDSVALSLLWSEFNPRCNPQWDQSNNGDAKDFERKVVQARSTNNKPMGWLLDDYGLRPGDKDAKIIALGSEIAERLLAGNDPTGFTPGIDFDDIEAVPLTPLPVADAVPAAVPDFLSARIETKTSKYPDEILNPPGLVGEMCRWINDTSRLYQPLLTLGAVLCASGALFGRKVKDESNARTNVYGIGVGPSSCGKDHAFDCIERLFNESGASCLLGGARVTSDTAIEVSLVNSPVKLFYWDEIGDMLGAIKTAGSGGGSYLKTIVPCLMSLYSSAHKQYRGKQKAEGDARRLDQPHVCVWGTTSPSVLYEGLSSNEIKNGWLGRLITFITYERPKEHPKKFAPIPIELVDKVRKWILRDVPPPEGEDDIRSAMSCNQILIKANKLANKVFEKFSEKCYQKMLKCSSEGDVSEFIWGKANQNAGRIALIIAAGENYDNPEISEANAIYACALIEYSVVKFIEAIQHNISENQFDSEKLKIINICRQAKRTGVSKTELTRKTRFLRDRKVRESYLQDLIEAEAIDQGIKNGKIWYWQHPFGVAAEINGGEE